jgi:pimeloyl-ACP methyl ester carboxylesterase
MTHGTSATITMVVDCYAEKIYEAGFNVLLFDHANFGNSEGVPRYEINPWVQGRGYRDAVKYLKNRDDVGKIALWGDSFSAMVALVASSLIHGIDAVVAQIPTCGPELPDLKPCVTLHDELTHIFYNGDVSGGPECTTGPLPVVSSDQLNAPSILTPIQAYRWFVEYGGRHGTKWENRVTRVIPPTAVPYNAYLAAPYITAPTLLMIGTDDEMIHCNPVVQRAVYDCISAPKEFCEVQGGHFGLLWHPSELFDEAVTTQIAFLKRTMR